MSLRAVSGHDLSGVATALTFASGGKSNIYDYTSLLSDRTEVVQRNGKTMGSDTTSLPTTSRPSLTICDLKPPPADVRSEVLAGLARPQKTLPCKLFYDRKGSLLFDRICRLPEYYPTRAETSILREHAEAMMSVLGPQCRLVEFGSGSSIKTRIVLDALQAPAYYVPIDISREHLLAAAESIARDYPHLSVLPVVADYANPIRLPRPQRFVRATRAFFPGSTIGNFEWAEARAFLRRVAELVRPNGGLLIGVDLLKDRATMERAYNDAQGVTAAFNLNILEVINREVGAEFDPSGFEHEAVFDEQAGRIEMRLCSRQAQRVLVDGHQIAFAAGEYIITEYSHKYRVDQFAGLARQAGFDVEECWRDRDRLFSVMHLSLNAANSGVQ
jgi:dimethylhistidine N-methyltransferase